MNHYEVLGVGPDATEREIKEAYRVQAMKWHPDRHSGAAAKGEADRRFKDLAVAYRTLRNAVERANYDRQLEQQLHREYNERQREQARQQREQNEQAQQKQTRQEAPREDFVDTGPHYEEEAVSGDDANQMFYEQMLDLAAELAGRGFPEFNIFKALVALGCPEALAKVVAAAAGNQRSAQHAGNGSTDAKAEPTAPENITEIVVKSKRHLAIFAALFGLWIIYISISLWSPLNSVWHVLIQIFGGLFGAKLFIHWGQVGIANALMIVNKQGIRFAHDSGRIKKWTEIQTFFFDGEKLKIGGIKDGKKWKKEIPKWLVSGDFLEVFVRISRLRNDYRSAIRQQANAPEKSRNWMTPLFKTMVFIATASILLAVALPAYQDYTRRAQLTTGFLLGSEAAKKVGDYYTKQKTGPGDLGDAGFYFTSSQVVRSVDFDRQTGMITITFQNDFFASNSLLLTPTAQDGQLTWLCTSNGLANKYLPNSCKQNKNVTNTHLASEDAEKQAKGKSDYAQVLAKIEAGHPELNPDSTSYNAQAEAWVVDRKKMYDQAGGRSEAVALQQAATDYATALQRNQPVQPSLQELSVPPLDPYISYVKSLAKRDQIYRSATDMGIKFPKMNGYLSHIKGDFRPSYPVQANVIEQTQTWGFNTNHGRQGGFIVFQNRTNQPLKGITVEIQAAEGSCANKGMAYYMMLEFDRPASASSVVGIDFQFPNVIQNSNRCMDVVDLLF